ncbi:MAG: DUF1835 domain-containing protein [Bacteroidota bacterium]
MKETLHILNGDAILNPFKKQGFEGKIMVWREILCEGRCYEKVGSTKFWKQRAKFFEKAYKINHKEHEEFTSEEFKKLERISDYKEVVLWFEYDLFCQVNMLALLSWISRHIDQTEAVISLVCIGEVEGYSKKVSLGEIDPALYPSLFEHREILSEDHLKFAQKLWENFASRELQKVYKLSREAPSVFKYVEQAFIAYNDTIPDFDSELNKIQLTMLSLIDEGIRDKAQLMRAIMERDEWYGFGDLQYLRMLSLLEPYLKIDDELILNKEGEKAISLI